MEALLLLMILTLGSSLAPPADRNSGLTVVRFRAENTRQEASKPHAESKRTPREAERNPSTEKAAPEKVTPLPKARQEDAATPPRLIQLSPKDLAAMDISALPKKPGPAAMANRPKMGPPDTGPVMRDSPRVSGSGPHGEPLYAASWYREPYEDELSGYLSTASGPGWGLIACRTAPDYRVEDCIKLDEYPTGSNIARAVLAAAWQFRVRPPRIGGEPQIGEWVRIRIDYGFVAKPPR